MGELFSYAGGTQLPDWGRGPVGHREEDPKFSHLAGGRAGKAEARRLLKPPDRPCTAAVQTSRTRC